MKLSDWLIQQIESDLLWATEASRDGEKFLPDGAHWQWVNPENDAPVEPDPGTGECMGGDDNFCVSLRSVEHFDSGPDRAYGPLPQFALYSVDEVSPTVGGHILRHDPARVIRDLRGRLKSVRRCTEAERSGFALERAFAGVILRDMAEAYAERPGYLNEWKSESEK